MPFVADILQHRSLSIVGMEKNTGKTVCLNYILRRLNDMHVHVGVTSIGVDGEQTDAVFATAKPEITLYRGSHFITSEKHYAARQLVSEIEATGGVRTALGVPVLAKVLVGGKVLLSGAATTRALLGQIALLSDAGCQVAIVDGALSRLSLASPAVTEAMILATGAAVSSSLPTLVGHTRFLYGLIGLPEVSEALKERLENIESGIWAVDKEGEVHSLGVASVFLIGDQTRELLRYGRTLFAAGAVSDRLLQALAASQEGVELIVKDFTRLFVSRQTYAEFVKRGGGLQVLRRPQLVAVTFNPFSPQGFMLDSKQACTALSEALGVPVYDVKQIER
ncbi:MAG: hypothetical protein IJU19_06255 [Bacteroidales bacterium]|nr:hypothetical protein [Bacteroidales bacterium]